MGLIRTHSLHHSVPNSQQYIPGWGYSSETVPANDALIAQISLQLSRNCPNPEP